MPIKLSACVCLFLCVMSMCVQCGSPSVGAWKAHPFSCSIHHANEPYTQLSIILTHNPTLNSPSSHSPVLSTFTPSFLSISGLCKSFNFFTPLFSCLCPILYLLIFLSVLYLAEQGPNLHSLWPLWERERGKFLWPSWWYWRLNPHLSHHLSLSPANAQNKPNRESKKKTILLPTISQCVSSFAYDHVVSGRDVFTHLSKKRPVTFSPYFFASHVFLKNMEPPENGRTIQIIFKKSSLWLKIAI